MTNPSITATTLSLLAAMIATAGATILFQDDFSGAKSAPLNATIPDVTQGGTAWVASADYQADGSASTRDRHAYLALGDLINAKRGHADAIFTLTARVNVNPDHTDENLWEGIGFWHASKPTSNFATSPVQESRAFIIRRGSSGIRAFSGPGVAKGADGITSPHLVDGIVDLRIVLDLTTWNGTNSFGTVSHFAKLAKDPDYVLVASGALNSTNSSFLAVGLGGGSIVADYSLFMLSQMDDSQTDKSEKSETEKSDGGGLADAKKAESKLKPAASGSAKFITRLADGQDIKIVVYGTSLTAGGAWVDQMNKWLSAKYPDRITLINSGLSGKGSTVGLSQLATKVLAHKPDVVFIEFAVNDAFIASDGIPKTSVAKSRENLNAMIQAIQSQNPAVEIILQTMNSVWDSPTGSNLSAKMRPNLADYYQMYRDVAAERGFMIIDHHPNWVALQKSNPANFKSYLADGIHPNAKGVAKVTFPLLQKRLSGDRPLP